MTTILQRADITLKSVRRRHYWADLDVRVTLRYKQSILNMETPEKRAQTMNFYFLKKIGLVGQRETKRFMGMALYVQIAL